MSLPKLINPLLGGRSGLLTGTAQLLKISKQDGLILIDAGPTNKLNKSHEEFQKLSIKLQDISLILITHGHWDHIGSISEIKSSTDCKVAINYREKDWVERALKPTPMGVGLGGSIGAFMVKFMISFIHASD